MFEIAKESIKGWKFLDNRRDVLVPTLVEVDCPSCRNSLVNLPLHWSIRHISFSWSMHKCGSCGEQIRFFLLDPPNSKEPEELATTRLYMSPPPALDEELPNIVETISPRFREIYRQAVVAESLNLNELNGMGYRKALEFLIKDYLSMRTKSADEKAKIEGELLGPCISKYVDNPKIKVAAQRAAWLGNDQTHYVRRWEDKDIRDLKILLKLTFHWIEMEMLSLQIEEEMPRPIAPHKTK